jgi:thioredoxin-related protein
MQLMGYVDKKKFLAVVDEYVMLNQRKMIRPFMQMRDAKNKPLYTVDKAMQAAKQRIIETYSTF